MPDLNLLILPLIGSYFLLSNTYRLYYVQQQLDRQRLIFLTFLYSFYLLVTAFAVASALRFLLPSLTQSVEQWLPIKQPWIGTSFLALLMGFMTPLVVNKFFNKEKSLIKAVRKYGNSLQNLLLESFLNKTLIMVTITGGKVYVGFIDSFPAGGLDIPYFDITPVFSGYRDEKHQLHFTTDYLEAYEGISTDKIEAYDDLNKIVVTLKTEDVVTSSPFNSELYVRFNPS